MEENNDELRELKEAIAKSENDENQKFEDYFKGLYDSLYKRYIVEYSSIQDREEKVSFLSDLLDEIIVAKHDEKHNFTISSIIARSKKKLDGLFKKFEYEIQDLTVFGKEKQTTENNILNEKLEVLSSKLEHLIETNSKSLLFLKNESANDKIPSANRVNFKNNFDDTDPKAVYDFFKEQLVSKGLLDETTLNEYLILAFDKCELPEKLFKFKKKTSKKSVRKIFGTYYKKIAPDDTYGKNQKYANLLGNYFDGHQIKSLASNLVKDVN